MIFAEFDPSLSAAIGAFLAIVGPGLGAWLWARARFIDFEREAKKREAISTEQVKKSNAVLTDLSTQTAENRDAIQVVHKATNSLVAKVVQATQISAHAQGVADEKARKSEENKGPPP